MSTNLIVYNPAIEIKNAELAQKTKELATYADGVKKNTQMFASTLAEVKHKALFKEDFDSYLDYAEKVFGIKQSYAYSLVSYADRYLDNGKIKQTFANFSPAQLGEMARAKEADVARAIQTGAINDRMDTAQIREGIKAVREPESIRVVTPPLYVGTEYPSGKALRGLAIDILAERKGYTSYTVSDTGAMIAKTFVSNDGKTVIFVKAEKVRKEKSVSVKSKK